ncbi:MAG: hypothetical protein CVU72_00610 [Deltaproteobacteria bacterium HGW-Deltaproteobacteria-7]|nr:MAG: hypothetical protein CVU72_00610 [Deltaproteobacteria bacterium HGW-Deltaproteobacteria-7]PKN51140.1 MAG: hypothetical protein CVU55_13485 [Deltaproteobacteria bacterium HGW-Deltaproteobacteria-13]
MINNQEKKLSGRGRSQNFFHVFNVYVLELALKSALFAAGIAAYVWAPDKLNVHTQFGLRSGLSLINIMWLLVFLSIMQKFFPQAVTSIGSRKHFKELFHLPPVEKFLGKDLAQLSDEVLNTEFFRGSKNYEILLEEKRALNRGALLVLLAWIILNLFIGALYFKGVINQSMLVLISMFYFASDMICVLMYCPFQKLFMKNRCCVTCRIFNWDSMMLCTPLLFIPSWFSLTLCSLALIVLIRWEIVFNRHPERFSERFNLSLRCAGCGEKLCRMRDSASPRQEDVSTAKIK